MPYSMIKTYDIVSSEQLGPDLFFQLQTFSQECKTYVSIYWRKQNTKWAAIEKETIMLALQE